MQEITISLNQIEYFIVYFINLTINSESYWNTITFDKFLTFFLILCSEDILMKVQHLSELNYS